MPEKIKNVQSTFTMQRFNPLTWIMVLIWLFGNGCQKPKANQTEKNGSVLAMDSVPSSFPVVQLTSGPKQHWFGYYDKWQVDFLVLN